MVLLWYCVESADLGFSIFIDLFQGECHEQGAGQMLFGLFWFEPVVSSW
jgi:hypothetical protein